jgi:xylulose-5-phosphate/fructose-6-phosphate phosphoketolase
METRPLDEDELRKIDAYWRAANYLSVGRSTSTTTPPEGAAAGPPREAAAARALGTTPGQNFIYAHLNRVIRSTTST